MNLLVLLGAGQGMGGSAAPPPAVLGLPLAAAAEDYPFTASAAPDYAYTLGGSRDYPFTTGGPLDVAG